MKKKLLIIASSVTLIVSLVAGMALPAFAAQGDPGSQAKPRAINGKVTEIDAGKTFFVVQTGAEKTVKIAVNNGTKYFKVSIPRKVGAAIKERLQQAKPRIKKIVPGLKQRPANQGKPANTPSGGLGQGQANPASAPRLPGEPATFEDIAVGDRVMVRVAPGTDPLLAQQVLIVKVTPSPFKRITGTISAISGNSVTITGDETVTVTVDENTNVVIKGALSVQPGQSAQAIYHKDTKVAKLLRVKPASQST